MMSDREMILLHDVRVVGWDEADPSSADLGNVFQDEFSYSTAGLTAGTTGDAGAAVPDASSYLIRERTPASFAKTFGVESEPRGYALKRAIDIVGSIFGLVLFAPLMIVVCMVMWAVDPGPIIFSQTRIGFGGRRFRILKFRTMYANADSALQSLLTDDLQSSAEWLTRQKLIRDPRITPLGRILRLSSIDELPQLINVLKGDMSLVGPRPIVDNERVRYGRYFDDYCAVRPGLTGLWQVSGRNNTTYRRRVAMDVTYGRRVSLGLDLELLIKTIPAIFLADGCY